MNKYSGIKGRIQWIADITTHWLTQNQNPQQQTRRMTIDGQQSESRQCLVNEWRLPVVDAEEINSIQHKIISAKIPLNVFSSLHIATVNSGSYLFCTSLPGHSESKFFSYCLWMASIDWGKISNGDRADNERRRGAKWTRKDTELVGLCPFQSTGWCCWWWWRS